jgi:hypothetical protein
MGMNTTIPRTHRASFNRLLMHKDPRIREAARQMQELDAQTRAEWRDMRRQEQACEDRMLEAGSGGEAVESELDDVTDCEDCYDDRVFCPAPRWGIFQGLSSYFV